MQTERTREKSVAECNLHYVFICSACGCYKSCNAVRPHIKVVLCVAYNGGLAGCTRRSVQTCYVFERCCEHSERIVVTEIRLSGIRYVLYVRQCLYLCTIKACLVKFSLVQRYIVITVFCYVLQFFKLELFKLGSRHSFNIFLEKTHIITLFFILRSRCMHS